MSHTASYCENYHFPQLNSAFNQNQIFSSHINRRTQFENPVLEAKRKLQQHNMPNAELGTKPMQAQGFRGTVLCQLS